MLPKKITLNDRLRKLIIDCRKSAKEQNPLLTADYISEQIGRAKSWLSQIENGRLKSVKTNDLINVFCYLQNRNKDHEEDRIAVAEYLDNEILYIEITQKHGIIDENGNIPDFSEMLSFQSARGHIKYAGENLTEIFHKLQHSSTEEIQIKLKKIINSMYNSVINWLNRAFSDTAELFSDEISTINLYLLIKTSIDIYNGNYEYFGLNPLGISSDELLSLKEKLNTDYFIKAKTELKPLNEYTKYEIDTVISHFSTEEYMTWKNKATYIGDDCFPMVINCLTSRTAEDNFISYEDVNTATGLSEKEYLYLIKQIYTQVDVLYKKCQSLLQDSSSYEDEIEEYISENESLKKEVARLNSLLNSNDLATSQ